MYVYSGVNKTKYFRLLRGHLQVLQALAIGD
jgi:hypothetical protein